MRYDATITAFDMMDKVHVHMRMRERADGPDEAFRTVLQASVTVQGEGQTEPARWLLEALVAFCETL